MEAPTSSHDENDTTKKAESSEKSEENKDLVDARPILPWISFFTGDWRDGLPMVRFRPAVCKCCAVALFSVSLLKLDEAF
jgi:hypothetical protein